MRDHGGNLDGAIKAFGGDRADWIDLSTGINTVPYPVGPITPEAWTRLPEPSALGALEDAARRAYGASCAVVPVSWGAGGDPAGAASDRARASRDPVAHL